MANWTRPILFMSLCSASVLSYGHFQSSTSFEQSLHSTTAQLRSAELTNQHHLSQLRHAQSTINNLRTSRKEAQAALEASTRKQQRLQQALQAKHLEIQALEKESVRTTKQNQMIIALVSDKTTLEEQLMTAKENELTLNRYLEATKYELSTQLFALEPFQSTQSASEQAVKNIQNQLAQTNTEIEALQSDIEAQKRQTSELKQQNRELRDSLDETETSLKSKEDELRQKDQLIEQLKLQIDAAKMNQQ